MTEAEKVNQSLLDRAEHGEAAARLELLERYRRYLGQLIAARLDRRIARRVDVSDIVQESLAAASERMDLYLKTRHVPFLRWLRRVALNHIALAHRHHLLSRKRSTAREHSTHDGVNSSSVGQMLLIAPDTSPSNRLEQKERSERVVAAMAELPPRDREVLSMWYMEQRDMPAIAEALGISEWAARKRHVRALFKLRRRLKVEP
jgi:RNA polymerase sigma-70 factor, ECF subfamily